MPPVVSRWYRPASGHFETNAQRDLRWLLDDARERYARWLAEVDAEIAGRRKGPP